MKKKLTELQAKALKQMKLGWEMKCHSMAGLDSAYLEKGNRKQALAINTYKSMVGAGLITFVKEKDNISTWKIGAAAKPFLDTL